MYIYLYKNFRFMQDVNYVLTIMLLCCINVKSLSVYIDYMYQYIINI